MNTLNAKTARLVACALLLALFATPSTAMETENEGWFQVTATGPIHGPLRLFLEAQPRIGEDPSGSGADMTAFIARGALGWEVKKGWSLWLGYAYAPTYHPTRNENRPFEQSTVDWEMGPFKAQHRARLEQRLMEDQSAVSWRLRNLLRITWPLPRWPTWALVASDEFFTNLNTVDNGPEAGFDQNRFTLGISHQLTEHVRIEVDYLNQAQHRSNGKENILRNSGVLQVAFGW